MTVPSPIRAVSVAVWQEGRFLLVRRARPPAQGLYAFPGGRVEIGETAVEAAIREVFEETGLLVEDPVLFSDILLAGPEATFELSVFLSRAASGMLRAGDDAAEAAWYELAEMEALPITESTLDIARQVAEPGGRSRRQRSCLCPNCR